MSKYKLGQICEICSSKRIFENEYVNFGIPFIRGLEISDGSLKKMEGFNCYISKDRYNELKKVKGIPVINDILITAVGTIGNLYFVNDNREFYFKDGNIIRFTNFNNKVYPKFLYYYMQSNLFRKCIDNMLIGAVQKALTIVMLSEIIIELPDISVQKRICHILEKIDDKIEINKAINDNLQNYSAIVA